jgi:adenylate cyclase
VDIPKVAEELGVGAVLEGSVRRAGDRVRITAQLINATDGFHLWAERYDRTLEDVFGVQEEIAHSIAEALRVTLTPNESKNLLHDRPRDVRAYDLYLKGRERYGEYSRESLQEALGLFQQAIEVDTNYALAWAGIADCHGQLLQYGYADQPEESKRLGLEAAERAIALNPRLAEGYKAQSLVKMYAGAPVSEVRSALEKAVEVDPRFTPALINLCVGEYMRGNLAAAERYTRRAIEADPQEAFAFSWLGYIAEVTRREEEALAHFRRVREIGTTPFYQTVSTIASGVLETRRGHLEAAREALAQSREVDWNPQNGTCLEAAIAAREGKLDRARELLQGMDETRGLGLGSVVAAASVAIRLGDLGLADRMVSRRKNIVAMPMTVRLYPELHPLLELPRFAPRRLDTTLVWPLEAPMIDAARFAVFREVKIESGLPEGPGVTSG